MAQWEYEVELLEAEEFYGNDALVQSLNARGLEGWELAGVVNAHVEGIGKRAHLIFKRPTSKLTSGF